MTFLKWVGGKGKLIATIKQYVPDHTRFIDPFIGGGSTLGLAQESCQIQVSDCNDWLINCYREVQSNPLGVMAEIDRLMKNYKPPQSYYKMRDQFNAGGNVTTMAALFIIINRLGFNGLYRVNRAGQINVPIGTQGRKTSPKVYSREAILEWHYRYNQIQISAKSYSDINPDELETGTVVILDPPYYPGPNTSFTGYSRSLFSTDPHQAHYQLAQWAKRASVNAWVGVCHTDDSYIRALYAGSEFIPISAPRSIGGDRKKVQEVLILVNKLKGY